MRRLPGPADADWAKEQKLRRLTTNCFGTGSEHKLNLLCGFFGALDSKWMSGSARQEPPAERHSCATRHPDQTDCALS
jgi:hypothetical protein